MYQSKNSFEDDSLIAAAMSVIARRSDPLPPVREVAQAAGLSAALINYRFGGLVPLAQAAFAAATQRRERLWAARGAHLVRAGLCPDDLAPLLLAVLQDHAVRHRDLAMLRWTGRCAAERGVLVLAQARDGQAAFWAEAANACGLGRELGLTLDGFFEGLSFGYLIAGGDAAFEVWAGRLVLRFAQRLSGGAPLAPSDSAYRVAAAARDPARDGAVDTPHETRIRIVEAAAALIINEGVEALTHRRLAARAGVSTSSIRHFFDSRQVIVAQAYEHVYQSLRDRAMSRLVVSAGPDERMTLEEMSAWIVDGQGADTSRFLSELLGILDLTLKAALDPPTRDVGLAMFARGGETSRTILARLAFPRGPFDALDAQIFRLCANGHWINAAEQHAGDPAEVQTTVRLGMTTTLNRLFCAPP